MRQVFLLCLPTALLLACGDKDDDSLPDAGSVDADGDHYVDIGAGGVDCDDSDDDIHPGAVELCDGVDNDCDGLVDDQDPDVDLSTGSLWYLDADEDGFGDESDAGTLACANPSALSTVYVADHTDCDDAEAGVNPGMDEVCDPGDVDEDCNGYADDVDPDVDASSGAVWYVDGDSDGHGDSADPGTFTCEDPSTTLLSYATSADDCDDNDDDISPSAVEICDGDDVDEDCSGLADDDDPDVDLSGATRWFPDADADGFGDFNDSGVLACDNPSASGDIWLDDDTDCDDDDAKVNPDAVEVCDEDDVDEDCNGFADDADGGVDLSGASTWFLDYDQDGFGDQDDPGFASCDDPSTSYIAFVADEATDCNDLNATVWPGNWEDYADGADNDCDGNVDETWQEAEDAQILFEVGTSSGYFGSDVAVGDFDGDGQDDVAFGAPNDSSAANNAGALFLFYGPLSAGRVDAEAEADLIVVGVSADDKLGRSLDFSDDFDGDGYGELVGAALGYDSDNGMAFVLHGPVTGEVTMSDAELVIVGEDEAKLGWFVAEAAGDLDDDGVDDIIIGEPLTNSDAGRVYLFGGATTGTLSTDDAVVTISGSSAGALGTNAASRVDFDGDGVDDLLLGSGESDEVYAFYGPLSGAMGVSDAAWTLDCGTGDFGDDIGTGDFDGDGTMDLAVGAPGDDTDATNGGAVYVFSGPISGTTGLASAVFVVTSADTGGALGDRWGAIEGGDFDGDGLDDLMLGARYVDSGATDSGHVGVALGPLSGTMDIEDADYNFSGSSTKDYLGNNLQLGDIDGDGLTDLVTGALQSGSPGEGYVFLGSGF